jgi:hypothetical protein
VSLTQTAKLLITTGVVDTDGKFTACVTAINVNIGKVVTTRDGTYVVDTGGAPIVVIIFVKYRQKFEKVLREL